MDGVSEASLALLAALTDAELVSGWYESARCYSESAALWDARLAALSLAYCDAILDEHLRRTVGANR